MKRKLFSVWMAVWLALFAIGCSLFLWVISGLYEGAVKEIEEQQAAYDYYLGKRIVIGTDTLTLTDYDMLQGYYHTTDGTKVAAKLVFKGDNIILGN